MLAADDEPDLNVLNLTSQANRLWEANQ